MTHGPNGGRCLPAEVTLVPAVTAVLAQPLAGRGEARGEDRGEDRGDEQWTAPALSRPAGMCTAVHRVRNTTGWLPNMAGAGVRNTNWEGYQSHHGLVRRTVLALTELDHLPHRAGPPTAQSWATYGPRRSGACAWRPSRLQSRAWAA